ncbi:hypothetical protein SPIROBIBN47_250007 [uncultured spirochete]|uniref:Uncharacterized protein n=1 Tax=uncultured spirochete TaxID=156406 RepID=A0A3P3XI52_9SPIR|nr:hypothetical protein SPIROBIBN47_250007 [uncultured spirochete]
MLTDQWYNSKVERIVILEQQAAGAMGQRLVVCFSMLFFAFVQLFHPIL